MPSLVKPASKRKGQPVQISSVYHIRYYCPLRRRSVAISTCCRRRPNAERCLREFLDLLERGEVGLENPFLKRRRERLADIDRLAVAECLADFESDLRAGRVRRGKRRPVSGVHADLTLARVRRLLEGCHLRRANELKLDSVNRLLDGLQGDGTIRTAQTRKHYERAIKSFSRWLATTGRLDHDPLGRLEVTCVEAADVVHDRGAFTTTELEIIAAAAREGPPSHGLTGTQRSLLYVFSACTGFRAKECAAVGQGDFGAELAYVRISGQFTKNGKEAMQPIPSFLRPVLAEYLAGLAEGAFLWPGGWEQDEQGRWVEAGWIAGKEAGEMLRRDAARVGIVIGRKGKEANGGRVLDFHSFRHSYVSALDRAGISEGLSRKLARASSRAILDRYTHREFAELSAAIEEIPAITVDGVALPGQARVADGR